MPHADPPSTTMTTAPLLAAARRLQPALLAAREAHEAVVQAAIDLIRLSQAGFLARSVAQGEALNRFDEAVRALGLAALEHLPLLAATEGAAQPVDEAGLEPLAEPEPEIEGAGAAGGPSTVDEPCAAPVAERGTPAAPALVDLRDRYRDSDEDSWVDEPLVDPGPLGSPPRVAVTAELLAQIQSTWEERSTGGAAPAAPKDPRRATLGQWLRLCDLSGEIEDEAAFDRAYRAVQSCADPQRLAVTGGWPWAASALACLWAHIHWLRDEVPETLRPLYVRGQNAYQALAGQVARQYKTSALGAPPLPRILAEAWRGRALRLAADLREAVKRTLESLPAASESPLPPSTPNVERELDVLERFLGEGLDAEALRRQVRMLLKAGIALDDPRLCALLVDEQVAFGTPEFKSLRQKLRRFAQAQQADIEQSAEVWAEAEALRGRRVLLVGGDRQTAVLGRLRARLPEVEVDWVETSPGGGIRQVQAARDRIAQGSVDVVLLVRRFLSHKVSELLVAEQRQRAESVALGLVQRGYGLGQIRLGLRAVLKRA